MSIKFRMLPCISARDLPQDVIKECDSLIYEFSIHGDEFFEISLGANEISSFPKLIALIVEAGIIDQETIDNMPSLEKYCKQTNLSPSQISLPDYHSYLDGKIKDVTILIERI
jgi:hypothetical protein